MSLFTIGEVAKQTGISVETVRFYEKQGLITKPQRTSAGYRQYSPEAIRKVHFIRRAKAAGFTLNDIGELLALRREPGASCSDVKQRALKKIAEVDQKIKDLRKIRGALDRLATKCSGTGGLDNCPILEAFEFGERSESDTD